MANWAPAGRVTTAVVQLVSVACVVSSAVWPGMMRTASLTAITWQCQLYGPEIEIEVIFYV